MGTARIGSRGPRNNQDPTPSDERLQDWQQVQGEIMAIEPTPMGLLITVHPVAADVSFYMRASGMGAQPTVGIVEGAMIEALMTPAGVRVRHVDRARSRRR